MTDTPTLVVVRARDVGKQLGVSIQTLRAWHSQGRAPYLFMLGGRLVALQSDVDDWLKQQRDGGRDVA